VSLHIHTLQFAGWARGSPGTGCEVCGGETRDEEGKKYRVAVVICTHSIAPLTCKIVYNHPIVLYVCVAHIMYIFFKASQPRGWAKNFPDFLP